MFYVFVLIGGIMSVFCAAVRYWTRTHVKVNCWFCGLNNTILKKCHDGWICKHCEQYNGFTSDGDYNRDIPAQWDSSLNSKLSFCAKPLPLKKVPSNGLCQECNRNQEMKVAQLASFQPINPENFDYEIDNFSYHLERAYRLCPPCEGILEETLSRKKTHVLDMNLLLTGKNSQNGKYQSSKDSFQKTLSQTSIIGTTILAFSIALSTFLMLSSDHMLFKVYDYFHNQKVLPELSISYPSSFASYISSGPTKCPQPDIKSTEQLTKPFLMPLNGYLESYLEYVQVYILPLSMSGLTLQGVSSWCSGIKLNVLLWSALTGIAFFQLAPSQNQDYIQTSQILQVVIAILIIFFSKREIASHKFKFSSSKKFTRNSSSTHSGRKMHSTHRGGVSSSNGTKGSFNFNPSSNTHQPPALSVSSSGLETKQNNAVFDTPNYLMLPSRPASVASHRTLTSASGLIDNSAVLDVQSVLSQEDTRSDASVDSAFSNPDSITLDAADPVNCSYQYASKKKNSKEGDVQSLIEGLSIGPALSQQSRKKSKEFETRSYGKEFQRSSLLSPPKLTNIMNDSVASGIWRDPRTKTLFTSPTDVNNQSVHRPNSPCGSVHSQASVHTLGPTRNCPSPSFQPMSPAWSTPTSASQGMLSVGVPPGTVPGNGCFGSPIPPVPNSPMSPIIYTSYGMYHPMMGSYANPVVCMMPPQSPTFSSRSPSSSFGSQFSPQSFSTNSCRDVNSFCGSGSHLSPQSSKGRFKIKAALSSSFLESVWQSRAAIMYTSLCYLFLGLILFSLSYSELFTSVYSKVMNWKEYILTSLR